MSERMMAALVGMGWIIQSIGCVWYGMWFQSRKCQAAAHNTKEINSGKKVRP